jgi:hypothetical protein
MRRKLTCLALCITAIGVMAIYHAESARATAASGFAGQNLIPFTATFGEFQVFNHLTKDQLQQLAPCFPAIPGYLFKRPRARQTCICRAILGSLVGAPVGTGILAIV